LLVLVFSGDFLAEVAVGAIEALSFTVVVLLSGFDFVDDWVLLVLVLFLVEDFSVLEASLDGDTGGELMSIDADKSLGLSAL
jgi:hypothetical protein